MRQRRSRREKIPPGDPGVPDPVRTGVARRLARAIHGFVFIEVDPFVIGLYRCCLGLYVLALYVMLAPSWLVYFGPEGISPYPTYPMEDLRFPPPILAYASSKVILWALYGVSVASALCLIAGVRGRAAVVWLWLMNISLIYRNPYVVNGEEQVLGVLLLFSIFLPLDASFTLRQWLDPERRRQMMCEDARVEVWSLRPMQVHIMLVYALSLPSKLADPIWREGTTVYYAMMAWDYPRWPGIELFAWGNALVSRGLTYFALLVEMLVPVLIWWRRWRLACVVVCALLHAGMGLLLEGVVMFNGAMLVALVAFLPDRTTRVWLARRLYGPDAA